MNLELVMPRFALQGHGCVSAARNSGSSKQLKKKEQKHVFIQLQTLGPKSVIVSLHPLTKRNKFLFALHNEIKLAAIAFELDRHVSQDSPLIGRSVKKQNNISICFRGIHTSTIPIW